MYKPSLELKQPKTIGKFLIMKCPHCSLEIHPNFNKQSLGNDDIYHYSISTMHCPNPKCEKMIIDLTCTDRIYFEGCSIYKEENHRKTIYPFTTNRNFNRQGIGDIFWNDYEEACNTLAVSPKASAALSRRCLQNILREKGGIKRGNLSDEIQQVIDKGSLPSLLADSIDAIRNIGNFAAHPIKDKSTGEIVDVEPGEAKWLLDVLENLMYFYFIQPQKNAERKKLLNQKLQAMDKPLMK